MFPFFSYKKTVTMTAEMQQVKNVKQLKYDIKIDKNTKKEDKLTAKQFREYWENPLQKNKKP